MKSPLFKELTFTFDNSSMSPKRLKMLREVVRRYGGSVSTGRTANIHISGDGLIRGKRQGPWISDRWILASVEAGRLLKQSDYRLFGCQGDNSSPPKPSHHATASFSSKTPSSSVLGDYQDFSFECQRRTPLNSPNDDLIKQLEIIEEHRYLTGAERSAYSYHRAIAALRAYPHRISSVQEGAALSGIGPKTAALIEEFLERGLIDEAQMARANERFCHLKDLCRVHGIGPRTAANLLDHQGIHSVAQLREAVKGGKAEELKLRTDQLIGLHYVEEFEQKLGRTNLETIADAIRSSLREDASIPDCRVVIVGGYRRGKTENGDADILVGPLPDTGTPISSDVLLGKLINALQEGGLITHLLQTLPGTSSSQKNKARTADSQVAHCLCVYQCPENGRHTRLDLVVALPEQWAFALLGWTGSRHYERSIRLWAERKCGLLLSSQGLEDRQRGTLLKATSEEEIFRHLDLPFIEPEYRNC